MERASTCPPHVGRSSLDAPAGRTRRSTPVGASAQSRTASARWRSHDRPCPTEATGAQAPTCDLAGEAKQRRTAGARQPHALAVAAHHDENGAGNVVFDVVETAAVSVLTDAV